MKKIAHSSTSVVASSVAPAAAPVAPVSSPASSPIATLTAPPPLASMPTVPTGVEPTGGADYKAVVPRSLELDALPGALNDLKQWTGFNQVFSLSGLQYAQVLQLFEIALAWSAMRKATVAWNGYCLTEEGVAWGSVRSVMAMLKPLFDMALQTNPSLASTVPNLTTFFNAKKTIAQKAASTRAANKAAKAKGEPETHGVVGKRRARVAGKAALAAQTVATPAPATSSTTTAATTVTPPKS